MKQRLTDFQQITMVRTQLSSIGLRDEEPWICVKTLIDCLLEHEKDQELLRRKLAERVKNSL